MPLPVGDLRAGEEDVLPGTRFGLFLLDLNFHDLGRVLNDLGNVGDVPRTDFTEDTLKDEHNPTCQPEALWRAK